MNLKLWVESKHGRAFWLAKAIDVPPSFMSKMVNGEKGVPIERCVPIERATDGAVTRQDLRPDDWQDIWPELAAVPLAFPGPDRRAAVADFAQGA